MLDEFSNEDQRADCFGNSLGIPFFQGVSLFLYSLCQALQARFLFTTRFGILQAVLSRKVNS